MHSFPLVHMQAKSIILHFYSDHPILNCPACVRQAEYLKGELLMKDALDTLAERAGNPQEFNLIFENLSSGAEGFDPVHSHDNDDDTRVKLQAIEDFGTELLKRTNAQISDFVGQIYPCMPQINNCFFYTTKLVSIKLPIHAESDSSGTSSNHLFSSDANQAACLSLPTVSISDFNASAQVTKESDNYMFDSHYSLSAPSLASVSSSPRRIHPPIISGEATSGDSGSSTSSWDKSINTKMVQKPVILPTVMPAEPSELLLG